MMPLHVIRAAIAQALPDPSWITAIGGEALLAAAAFVGSLSLYKLAPAITARMSARTATLTERQAVRADAAIERLNGRLVAALAESAAVRDLIDARVRAGVSGCFASEQVKLNALDEWRREHDATASAWIERIVVAEAAVKHAQEQIRDHLAEQRASNQQLMATVLEQAKALQGALHALELKVARLVKE